MLISREEAISNSFASLGLMAAQVQSQIAGNDRDSARESLESLVMVNNKSEEYNKLLENLILPTLGKVQLRYLEPDRIRRWYSTALSEDRPTQRKHAYALLRSILAEAEDEGLIERNPCRIRPC